MNIYTGAGLGLIIVCVLSCSISKKAYTPSKKYPVTDLRNDYLLLKDILEKKSLA